jgi:hypothetical protein
MSKSQVQQYSTVAYAGPEQTRMFPVAPEEVSNYDMHACTQNKSIYLRQWVVHASAVAVYRWRKLPLHSRDFL